jgi:hypothetical protein
LLADVRFPILGADFLRHHKLLVDMADNQLIPASSLPLKPAAGDLLVVTAVQARPPLHLDSIINEFPEIFRPLTST